MRRGLIAGLALLAAVTCGPAAPPTVLATTTSMANSGVLDQLVPVYERDTGGRLRVVPAGSGRALRLLSSGEADVVISHAPRQEQAALQDHPDWAYRKILYNDFLIAGPASDPAGVEGAADALDAMRRIAASGARFVSRGDESGTHERERQLWSDADVAPAREHIISTGQGMSATLRVAAEMNAYTLTDRGTFVQLAPRLPVRELNSGDPRLLNTYAIIFPSGNTAGRTFARWLTEGKGRDTIAALITSGSIVGFTRWPDDRPRERPGDLPM